MQSSTVLCQPGRSCQVDSFDCLGELISLLGQLEQERELFVTAFDLNDMYRFLVHLKNSVIVLIDSLDLLFSNSWIEDSLREQCIEFLYTTNHLRASTNRISLLQRCLRPKILLKRESLLALLIPFFDLIVQLLASCTAWLGNSQTKELWLESACIYVVQLKVNLSKILNDS